MEEVLNNIKNIELRQKARGGKIREAERKLEATQGKVRACLRACLRVCVCTRVRVCERVCARTHARTHARVCLFTKP